MAKPGAYRSRSLTCVPVGYKQFMWTVTPGPCWTSAQLDVFNYDGVSAAVVGVQKAVADLCKASDQSEGYSDTQIRFLKEQLRQRGAELSRAAFGSSATRIAEWAKDGHLKLLELTLPELNRHDWPIEFCVFDDPAGVEGSFFLGEACVALRRPFTNLAVVPAAIFQQQGVGRSGPLSVGYAEDDLLGSACQVHGLPSRDTDEAVAIGSVFSGTRLDFLPPMASLSTSVDRAAFNAWLAHDHDVKHFNAHGEIYSGRSPSFRLRVRRGRIHRIQRCLSALGGYPTCRNACVSQRMLQRLRPKRDDRTRWRTIFCARRPPR